MDEYIGLTQIQNGKITDAIIEELLTGQKTFYKNNKRDKVWWVDTYGVEGPLEISFDKKKIYNLLFQSRVRHTEQKISGPCWKFKLRRNKWKNLHFYIPFFLHFYIDFYTWYRFYKRCDIIALKNCYIRIAWMGACRECRRLFYVRYFRTESSKSCGTTFYIEFRRIACVSKR